MISTCIVLPPQFNFYVNYYCSCNSFVHMDDEAAASTAVAELNGTDVKGRHIKVEKSESKGPRKPSQKLFIGNIREGTTNDELREVLLPAFP